MRKLSLIAAVALILTAGTTALALPSTERTLTVVVTDTSGIPIESARVDDGARLFYTNSSGKSELPFHVLQWGGWYTITVQKEGYVAQDESWHAVPILGPDELRFELPSE